MSAPKFSKNKVEQTIELDEVFGIDFSNKRELREYIGQLIIDRIKERTLSGVGMKFSDDGKGREFDLTSVPYSKKYVDSMEFKAFGKKKGDVNLKLSGDMLGLMDIKKQSGNAITIGWDDADENKKAYNHSVGDTVPARPFFGVSKLELKQIAQEIKPRIREAIKTLENQGRSSYQEKILSLIDELDEDGED